MPGEVDSTKNRGDPPDEIQAFFRLASQYFTCAVQIWEEGRTAFGSEVRIRIKELERFQSEVRDRMLSTGPRAARLLEEYGVDPSRFLLFLHKIDTLEKHEVVKELWANVKVSVQRAFFQKSLHLSKSDTDGDEAPDAPSYVVHLTGMSRKVALYIIDKPGSKSPEISVACITSKDNVRKIFREKLKPLGFDRGEGNRSGYFPPD